MCIVEQYQIEVVAEGRRQVETQTTEAVERAGKPSCISQSTHARAMSTCAHSHTAHTHRKWLECGSCPHSHLSWSGTFELMQSCLELQKTHPKHWNQNLHTAMSWHTHMHTNEWSVSLLSPDISFSQPARWTVKIYGKSFQRTDQSETSWTAQEAGLFEVTWPGGPNGMKCCF